MKLKFNDVYTYFMNVTIGLLKLSSLLLKQISEDLITIFTLLSYNFICLMHSYNLYKFN